MKRLAFPTIKIVALHKVGFPNCWRNSVITWLIIWPVLTFYALRHWLPNASEWNNCPHLLLSTMQSAQVATRKCDLGCGHIVAWSHVLSHRGLPSLIKSCHVRKCRPIERNKSHVWELLRHPVKPEDRRGVGFWNIVCIMHTSYNGECPTAVYSESTVVTKLWGHISHLKLHLFYWMQLSGTRLVIHRFCIWFLSHVVYRMYHFFTCISSVNDADRSVLIWLKRGS
jgi:hypothetical protein